MSKSLVPMICVGLAVYGWVALFCRSLHEHGYTMSPRQQYVCVALLIIAVLLSVLHVEGGTNPFLQVP
jgi:hypothetical protein